MINFDIKLINFNISINLTNEVVGEFVKDWLKSLYCYHHEDYHDYNSVAMEHSPRFDMYRNEFGVGKPLLFINDLEIKL